MSTKQYAVTLIASSLSSWALAAAPAPVAVVAPVNTLTIRAAADPSENAEISAINKTVISQTEMLRYGDASVSDALRRAVGIQLGSSANGGGGAKKAKFRGAGAAPTLLVNGETVQGGRRGDTSLIDTFSVDMISRIEVTKQASVTQGSVASGGVINIILKDPREGSLGGVAKVAYGELQQDGQSNQRQQFSLQADGRKDAWGGSVSANDSQMDNQSRTDLLSANGTSSSQTRRSDGGFRMFAPRLNYTFANQDKAFLELFLSQHHMDSLGQNSLNNSVDRQKIDSAQNKINARFEQKNGERKDTWRLSAEFANEQQRTLRGTPNAQSSDQINEHTDSLSASYGGSQKLGDAHQLKFGGKIDQSRLSSSVERTLVEQRHALYIEDNWKISAQQTLTSGLRQEWLQRDGLINYNDDSLSPALAWRYLFSPAWSLQLSASQARNTPRTDDLSPTVTLSTNSDAGSVNNPDRGGNPALRAERIQATEISSGYNSEQGGVNITVFRRSIDDYIERSVTLENGRYVQRPQNQAQALATGIELDGRINISKSGGHSLLLNGQLSTIRAEIQRSGQADRLASDVAPYSASLGMSYQYQPWRWSINSNIGYTPSYTRQVEGAPFRKTQNDRTTLDLSSTKRFDGGWAMTVAATNLLGIDRTDTLYNNDGSFSQRRNAESLPSLLLTLEHRF